MGNASSTREGGEEGQSDDHEVQKSSQDLVGMNTPCNPREAAANTPMLFTPQNPTVPLQRLDEMHSPNESCARNLNEYEDIIFEQGIPTMITWNYGGKEVFVEGSWDDWKTKKPLHRSGKEFTIMKVLPSGVYKYRFIVDGEWRYAPEVPWMSDDMGNVLNVLDLQDSVPENLGSIAGFEHPLSPESSYNNWALSSEDYAKEPPVVPPQLSLTLLNTPASVDRPCSLPRPQHVILDHLYIQKGKSSQPYVALGTTRRFQAKHVTVVLYKSVQR